MAAAGDVIAGKYRLVEPFGGASEATVWLAEHTSLQTPVAVKFVQRARGEIATKRFLAEAKAAGAVRHPNVVGILDFGATEGGEPYMVLEFLEGETLRARLDRDPPMSAGAIVDAAVQALSGLAAVHDRQIVHRDVRPANVFLVDEADGRVVKLLDFGVSKSFASATASALTMEGDVLGSPQYISPEQLRGDRELDGRADLFSIGVILYEGLAGHCPFEGSSFREIVRSRGGGDPPPLASLRSELAALSEVVARAMAREREQRFDDARSMRQALLEAASSVAEEVMRAPGPARGSLRGTPAPRVRARPPGPAPARRSPLVPALVIVGLIAIAAVAVQLGFPGGWASLLGLAPRLDDPGVSGAITPVDGGTVEALPAEPAPPRE